MKALRRSDVLWGIALGLISWAWFNGQLSRARADERHAIQADSMVREIAALEARDRHREVARAALGRLAVARADSLRGLRRELNRLSAAGATAGAALVAHAERDTSVSDSLRGLIRLTLGIMDRSARACNAALTTCDSIVAGKDAVIAQLDSTRVEFHAALHRTTDLWEADRKRLRRERRDLSLCVAGGHSPTGWTALLGVCYRLIALPPW